jgi:hypothetical protein
VGNNFIHAAHLVQLKDELSAKKLTSNFMWVNLAWRQPGFAIFPMEPEPLQWILHYTLIGQESHAIEALEETLSVRVPSTESEPLRRILHRTLIHQESVLKTVHLSYQDIRHSTFDDRT